MEIEECGEKMRRFVGDVLKGIEKEWEKGGRVGQDSRSVGNIRDLERFVVGDEE